MASQSRQYRPLRRYYRTSPIATREPERFTTTIETDSDNDEEDRNMYVMHDEEQYSSEEGEESGENEGVQEGYDCMFVEPGPGDDHKCPICHLVVRDSYQVNCCGKILCRTCLFKHKSSFVQLFMSMLS